MWNGQILDIFHQIFRNSLGKCRPFSVFRSTTENMWGLVFLRFFVSVSTPGFATHGLAALPRRICWERCVGFQPVSFFFSFCFPRFLPTRFFRFVFGHISGHLKACQLHQKPPALKESKGNSERSKKKTDVFLVSFVFLFFSNVGNEDFVFLKVSNLKSLFKCFVLLQCCSLCILVFSFGQKLIYK